MKDVRRNELIVEVLKIIRGGLILAGVLGAIYYAYIRLGAPSLY